MQLAVRQHQADPRPLIFGYFAVHIGDDETVARIVVRQLREHGAVFADRIGIRDEFRRPKDHIDIQNLAAGHQLDGMKIMIYTRKSAFEKLTRMEIHVRFTLSA